MTDPFEHPLAFGLCCAGLALSVILVVLWLTREPPCLRGHTEIRHVPKRCDTEEIASVPVNDISIPIYGEVCHEAHDVPVFVCDQFELEKEPSRP